MLAGAGCALAHRTASRPALERLESASWSQEEPGGREAFGRPERVQRPGVGRASRSSSPGPFRGVASARSCSPPCRRALSRARKGRTCLSGWSRRSSPSPVVTRVETEADLVRFLDHQGLNAWGYDLNHDNHAHETEVVNELRFVVTRDDAAIAPNCRGPAMPHATEAGSTAIPDARSRRSAPPSTLPSIRALAGSCCRARSTSSAPPNSGRASARPMFRKALRPTAPLGVFPSSMTTIASGP